MQWNFALSPTDKLFPNAADDMTFFPNCTLHIYPKLETPKPFYPALDLNTKTQVQSKWKYAGRSVWSEVTAVSFTQTFWHKSSFLSLSLPSLAASLSPFHFQSLKPEKGKSIKRKNDKFTNHKRFFKPNSEFIKRCLTFVIWCNLLCFLQINLQFKNRKDECS